MGNDKPLMTHKAELHQLIPTDALVVVGNDQSTHIMLYHLNRKGWTFDQNDLSATKLSEYVQRGATYICTTDPFVASDTEMQKLLAPSIFQKDGLWVYPLAAK
jgi:hypothetical protein